MAGGEVMGCGCVVFAALVSRQPQIYPGVWQSGDVGAGMVWDVVIGSLHPNQPGVWHVVEEASEVLVAVGMVLLALLDDVVVTSSLQPNQPGVLHEDVDDVVVIGWLVVVAPGVVVVSSRHPHHPGV